MKKGTLVLVRHGESQFNRLNLFTGWVDVPLSVDGIHEAEQCAKHCVRFNYGAAFTSNLGRARETLLIILSRQNKIGVFQHPENAKYHKLKYMPAKAMNSLLPIVTSKALNERAYGMLQGMNKNTANRQFGASTVFKWRRGYADRPPGGESLKDVYNRVISFFNKKIKSKCARGQTVLVSAHGNTPRSIIKHIEKIDDKQICFVNLPNAHPLVCHYQKDGFVRVEGEYQFDRLLR